jgi:hypothetical protein
MSENIYPGGRTTGHGASGVASHTNGPHTLTREHMAKTNGRLSSEPPPPDAEMERANAVPPLGASVCDAEADEPR